MLTGNNQQTAQRTITTPPAEDRKVSFEVFSGLLTRLPRTEWLGQTVASVCWILSVLAYGISSTGDWLQLFAASSWLIANLAAER